MYQTINMNNMAKIHISDIGIFSDSLTVVMSFLKHTYVYSLGFFLNGHFVHFISILVGILSAYWQALYPGREHFSMHLSGWLFKYYTYK